MSDRTPPRGGRHSLSVQLRDVIESRGLGPAELARDSGVDARVIGRFVAGERTITLETADRLAAALGLRLVEVARRPAPARKPSARRPATAPIPDHAEGAS